MVDWWRSGGAVVVTVFVSVAVLKVEGALLWWCQEL